MSTEFERIVLEKLSKLDVLEEKFDTLENRFDTMENRFDTMENRFDNMENRFDNMEKRLDTMETDLKSVKKTALKVETELIPKTQLMLDNYMNIAEKVNISSDLQEEVKTLRYEVDIIKQILSVNNQ
ncbi:MAG: hypothetical protein IJN40_05420 [Clostridia bacterium]|nr:hypothetical protein [Clostridia bacterium]